METIGFIGLGNMGKVIATNLLESGYPLQIYNRTKQKVAELIEKGATSVENPNELFSKAGSIVISMLANDQAVEEIIFGKNGLEESLQENCIHLSMSTISPNLCAKLNQHHSQKGAHFIAAPVFGLPPVAALRKLTICYAGDPNAKNRVQPILKLLGQKLVDFGNNPVAALIVKLVGNYLIIAAAQALAEGFTVAQKYNIDPTEIANFFSETIFNCPIYKSYGKRVALQEFDPALFRLSLGLKDLTLLHNAANDVQAIMPIGDLIRQAFSSAEAIGRGNLDWTAIALFISEGNKTAFEPHNP